MKKGIRFILPFFVCMVMILTMTGCTIAGIETVKLKNLEFTVLGEEKIPAKVKELIEEKKEAPFSFTYKDAENQCLYLCVGYGKQEMSGYSIAVEDLYLTENNICLDTELIGPKEIKKGAKAIPSCPVIVLKTEYSDQTVLYE